MSDESDKEDQRERKVERPLEPGEVVVQCDGFRCLALQDHDGNWLDLAGKPLKVLHVITRIR